MKKLIFATLIVSALALVSLADVRIPDTPKPTPTPKAKTEKGIDSRLTIRLDSNAKEARLKLSADQIKSLRAQLDEIDGPDNVATVSSVSRTQTIVSGMFLCLAFVFGGVWLIRSRGAATPGKGAAIVAVIAAVGALATVTVANIGPPLDARKITSKLFTPSVHMYKQASGPIKLEISKDESEVVLIVPDPAPNDPSSPVE